MSSPLPSVFSRGPVSTLQEMLRTISFVDQTIPFIRPTGRFDEATLEAVMRFQKEAGLPVTGTVDRQTWDAIMQAFLDARARLYSPRSISLFPPGSEVIQRGQSAPLLYPVQAMFCALADTMTGVLATLPTGVLDEGTAENLRWLQRNANLPETGNLDQATWEMLIRLFETFSSTKPIQVIDNGQEL